MAVEAGRAALRGAARPTVDALYFATADPAYLDKTNATEIHAALDLRPTAPANMSDVRIGLPGGTDEREGGDAAAAFRCGDDGALAEPIGAASATAEFLDRWRLPGGPTLRQWEERFGEAAYVPLGEAALGEALKRAGVTAQAVTRLIVAGPHGRAVKRVAAGAGVKRGAVADDLTAVLGNTGAAHAGRLLADEVIAVVSLAPTAPARSCGG